jgi:AcrR family transcriptional regulator
MPYRRTPAVQAKLDASREAILRAAVALLAEQGYAGCSVAAVAARAGVATGSVYRHFPSKTDLLTEVFRLSAGREVAAVADAANRPGTAAERAVAVVETFAGRALKSPRLPGRDRRGHRRWRRQRRTAAAESAAYRFGGGRSDR